MVLPRNWATVRIGELRGTRIADPSGFACSAPTTAIGLPPAAAKTGGASPTVPISTDPAAMACSIGGPEVKSDQSTLKGSLPISPSAVSSASSPEPAWSPMCSVTLATVTGLADAGELAAGDAAGELAADEHAAMPATSRLATAMPVVARGRRMFLIVFLPYRRPARRAGECAWGWACGRPGPVAGVHGAG